MKPSAARAFSSSCSVRSATSCGRCLWRSGYARATRTRESRGQSSLWPHRFWTITPRSTPAWCSNADKGFVRSPIFSVRFGHTGLT